MKELAVELVDVMERLIESVERLSESSEERVAKLTAAVESEVEVELRRRLEEAEAKIAEANGKIAEADGKIAEANDKIAELSASVAAGVAASAAAGVTANAASAGRKTGAVGAMVAKHGDGLEVGALDAALASLSVEQRIAVKAELLRSGAIA